MKFESLLEELKKLNLPKGSFSIAGSGLMAVRNIREGNDLDIIVTEETFQSLLVKYPNNLKKEPFDHLEIGNIEISHIWQQGQEKSEKLIKESEEINGLPFVKLERVIEWKKRQGREKDKIDLGLIEKWQKN